MPHKLPINVLDLLREWTVVRTELGQAMWRLNVEVAGYELQDSEPTTRRKA